MLAEALHGAGISSYRYEKRGVGKSTLVSGKSNVIQDRLVDITGIIDYFTRDFEEIILLGHSEGVLVGSIVAAEHPQVKKFVAVAGTSISFDKILIEQFEKYPKILPEVKLHFEELKSGKEYSEVHMILERFFNEDNRSFYESVCKLQPLEEISKVTKPVLVISGDCDLQILTYHTTALHKSCPGSELKIISGMGHVLKQTDADCGNARDSYSDPTIPLNPEFIAEILRFLKAS